MQDQRYDQQNRTFDAVDGEREQAARDRPPHPLDGAQAGDVAASNTREGGFLGQRINVLLGRGLPDTQALVDLLEKSTPEERAAVAADGRLMDRLIGACPLDRLPAVLELLVRDPKWALYHYLCRRGGRDPDAARQLLAGTTTAQQLEIVRWAELVGRLHEVVGGDPAGLFGAALGPQVDAERARGDRRLDRFQAWRAGTAGVDAAAALQTMARDPASLAAGLRGQPSTWSHVVAHGAPLAPTERGHLDRIALTLRGLDLHQLREAFALRFGVDVEAEGLDETALRAVWARLAPLDPGRVDRHVVERACRDPFGGAGWQVADFVDETTREPSPPPARPDEAEQTPGAADRAAADRAALLDAFAEACGGDAALREAAQARLDDRLDDAGWRSAVTTAEARGVLAVPAAEVLAAFERLRTGDQKRISVAGPGAAPSPRPATAEAGPLPGWIAGLGPRRGGG